MILGVAVTHPLTITQILVWHHTQWLPPCKKEIMAMFQGPVYVSNSRLKHRTKLTNYEDQK